LTSQGPGGIVSKRLLPASINRAVNDIPRFEFQQSFEKEIL
jgi:hypothetical protein